MTICEIVTALWLSFFMRFTCSRHHLVEIGVKTAACVFVDTFLVEANGVDDVSDAEELAGRATWVHFGGKHHV